MSSKTETKVAFSLWPKQMSAMKLLFVDGVGQLLYGGAAGPGKALDITTPIPTPSGWTTMGELAVGDVLFDEHGAPTRVVNLFDVIEQPVSYRLTFDDGSFIDACEDHEWLTFDSKELAALTRHDPAWRARRRETRLSKVGGNKSATFSVAVAESNRARVREVLPPPTGSVRTTATIAETVLDRRGRRNHAIPVAGALDLPHADLPLDPYLLGLWLGDGSTNNGLYTSADDELVQAFVDGGFSVTDYSAKYAFGVRGIQAILRKMGVLGDKHIPTEYLRASRDQRLAVLQGLMDTDGSATRDGGAEFTTTRRELADGVHELISSLGWKARIAEGRATLNGKDCGPKYRINFTPSDYVFRLTRKRDQQRPAVRRTIQFRYVVSCERIEPKPMRCISVDSPTHLFLAGRQMVPTHNSKFLRALAYHCSQVYPGARISIFRDDYTQLEKTQIAEWKSDMFALGYETKEYWRESAHEWRFPNPYNPGRPTVIEFLHIDQSIGAEKWQSAEFTILLVDEATQIKREDLELLFTRVRVPQALKDLWAKLADEREAAARKNGIYDHEQIAYIRSDWQPRAVYATNPGGASHEFFKEGFVDEAAEHDGPWDVANRVFLDGQTIDVRTKRAFLPAFMTDNPSIDPVEYAASLSILGELRKRQLLNGDWNYFQGKAFDMLDEQIHLVDVRRAFGNQVSPPLEWPRLGGHDHGTQSPTAAEWVCRDEDNFLICYMEYYSPGSVGQHIDAIRSLMLLDGKTDIVFEADPRMWTKSKGVNRMWSVADEYAYGGEPPEDAEDAQYARRDGITVHMSKIERIAARMALQRLFEPNPNLVFPEWHPNAGQHGAPRLFIGSNCKNLWRELNNIRFVENSEDTVKENDHAYDALSRVAPMFEQALAARRQHSTVRTVGYRSQQTPYAGARL